jgi:hypothetical protein
MKQIEERQETVMASMLKWRGAIQLQGSRYEIIV